MNKNLALTLTAATLFIVIGIMAAWWFNGGNIDSVKPYVDPYNNYTEAELTAMLDKGDIEATAELGWRNFNKGDFEKAYALFKKAAEKNNAKGLTGLGRYYTHIGKYGESFKYFEAAAEQGYTIAIFNLGVAYANGDGCEQDDKKAFTLFEEAAKKGYSLAQRTVGAYYLDGVGTVVDKKKGFMWFKKAAEQNDARAFWNLGKCYLDGEGTEKDEAKAIEYYQKSASAGDMYGQAELALAYQFGQGGLKEDPKKAFELYQLSATQGLASAQSLLAYCYENGVGTKKDKKKAFEYYMLSAKQGYDPAQYSLALCYWNGTGTERNLDKLRYWAGLAAKQGNKEAKNMLANLSQWIYEEEQQKREYERKYGHIGTFEFTDDLKHDWVLVVKKDETAIISTKDGYTKVYAHWDKYDTMNYAQFSCSEQGPLIAFPGSDIYINNGRFVPKVCGYFCIDGKYIYYDSDAADAKNPDLRLPLTKIK